MQARFLHIGEMLVLHVFIKKTQTTPRRAIETALKRLEEST
jgi:phage-related protein